MPTYDYVCQNCHHEFEKFQPMSAALLTKCPECGQKKLKRLVGKGAGLIFKGTGFYITDYKNKSSGGEPKPADAKSGADAKAGSDAKAASDGKSAPPSKSTRDSKSASESKSPSSSTSAPTTSSTTTSTPKKQTSS